MIPPRSFQGRLGRNRGTAWRAGLRAHIGRRPARGGRRPHFPAGSGRTGHGIPAGDLQSRFDGQESESSGGDRLRVRCGLSGGEAGAAMDGTPWSAVAEVEGVPADAERLGDQLADINGRVDRTAQREHTARSFRPGGCTRRMPPRPPGTPSLYRQATLALPLRGSPSGAGAQRGG
jgi:hypothetical protein